MSTAMKILVSDSLSKQGIAILEKAGFTVDVKTKLSKEELLKEIKQYDGLIVRSGTKVTADVNIIPKGDAAKLYEAKVTRQFATSGGGSDPIPKPMLLAMVLRHKRHFQS